VLFSGVRGDPGAVCSYSTTLERPKPGKDQVLVRVLYSPVHPSNLASLSPVPYPGPEAGASPGSEAVGVVEEHGEGCTAPAKGTRVLVLGVGTWREYVVLHAASLVAVPYSVSNSNAAQFFVNPMSAYLMSREFLTPQKGEYLLQTAAGSALGRVVIQLGKHFGFKTINVIRNEQNKAELLAAGADEVIVTSKESVKERVAAITGGTGVKYAIDCVGGDATSDIIASMAYNGKLLIYGALAKEEIHFASGLMVVKLLTIQGFWLSDWGKSAPLETKGRCIKAVMELFATGKISCPTGKEFELKDFAEAFKASADSKIGGGGKVMFKCS